MDILRIVIVFFDSFWHLSRLLLRSLARHSCLFSMLMSQLSIFASAAAEMAQRVMYAAETVQKPTSLILKDLVFSLNWG